MLKPVDQVETFSNDKELEELIKGFNPDIMIVGSDWKNKPVIGSQFAKRLIFFDRIDEYSSTKTIQSIIDRR
jgi:bifunctional ADP-heptose synthase (sugar kinase/adenylyltransferase)